MKIGQRGMKMASSEAVAKRERQKKNRTKHGKRTEESQASERAQSRGKRRIIITAARLTPSQNCNGCSGVFYWAFRRCAYS